MEQTNGITESVEKRKRPGRVPQGNERFNVMLPADLAEWAKHQPVGMSETIRRLLKEAKDSAEKAEGK